MALYEDLLKNKEYLEIVNKIESMKLITDGKWDWEHGLGHYKRVAEYSKKIGLQLNADERSIDLSMFAALLHDLGLIKGNKTDHAIASSQLFVQFIADTDVTEQEKEILRQAIADHSKGDNIQSMIGLSLVLADKLDVTYHRTENSSIQDKMNQEIQKIRQVDLEITDSRLIVKYKTNPDFDVRILKEWNKAVFIPKKAAEYLGKKYVFMINGHEIDYKTIFK